MKPEDYATREEEILGWRIRISSYRLGKRYHATVENVDPGARIARGEGSSRDEAEHGALEKARERLARTRRLAPDG
ncbi:MAG: hypothetical protein HY704_13695 [Gemmatimonadetes bacterium]|nr:hypothetical protein [Gemmatimonadota bacterium]